MSIQLRLSPTLRLTACSLLLLASDGLWASCQADDASRHAAVAEAMKSAQRSPEDLARDAAEKPAAIVAFAGLSAGSKIADVHAGDGYLTEVLLSHAQPYGKVFANNDPDALTPEQAAAWTKRLATPDAADIAGLKNSLAHPLPTYVTGLVAVFHVGAYHDAIGRGLDRKTMNQSAFEALAPGGTYVVSDARAAAGMDSAQAAALCRSSVDVVRKDIEAIGFAFVEESKALADASDKGTSNACTPGLVADRYLLKFQRPAL